MSTTDNLRVAQLKALIAPQLLVEQNPIDDNSAKTIAKSRHEVVDIIRGTDKRLVVIVGPCSIHDTNAALEYADKIKQAIPQYQKYLKLVMRVYFEKPRTTVGWKGLINDPDLDNSFDINAGLAKARDLLLAINRQDVPTATEFLDTIIPQYICDLITWSAIGARTTESQIHRELASGLSMPVGFKNSTTGSIQVAADAVCAAAHAHHFLGVSKQGIAAIVDTLGNPDCHIILRGSNKGPNYDAESVASAVAKLSSANLTPRLMVDLSHGNSGKDHKRQQQVAESISAQIKSGSQHILGVMIESNLVAGKQSLSDKNALTYGQSITDACVDWEETLVILDKLANAIASQTNKK